MRKRAGDLLPLKNYSLDVPAAYARLNWGRHWEGQMVKSDILGGEKSV
jgi:hypothetical protein